MHAALAAESRLLVSAKRRGRIEAVERVRPHHPGPHPLAALTLAEVLATSDIPAGVVNIISGQRKELLPWLAAHMDVNAIDVAGCTTDEIKAIEESAAGNVKRVIKVTEAERSPYLIAAFMEMKTVWHPIGV